MEIKQKSQVGRLRLIGIYPERALKSYSRKPFEGKLKVPS